MESAGYSETSIHIYQTDGDTSQEAVTFTINTLRTSNVRIKLLYIFSREYSKIGTLTDLIILKENRYVLSREYSKIGTLTDLIIFKENRYVLSREYSKIGTLTDLIIFKENRYVLSREYSKIGKLTDLIILKENRYVFSREYSKISTWTDLIIFNENLYIFSRQYSKISTLTDLIIFKENRYQNNNLHNFGCLTALLYYAPKSVWRLLLFTRYTMSLKTAWPLNIKPVSPFERSRINNPAN